MGFFPVHGSDVKAASRDTRCMKSACRPKQPAPTIGCRCSKSANSATKRLRDQREAAPKKYAVMKSPFDCLFPLLFCCCFVFWIALSKFENYRHQILKFGSWLGLHSVILFESSLPLGLMHPPRAAEGGSFGGRLLLLLQLVPPDGARRWRLLRLAGLCLPDRLPFP